MEKFRFKKAFAAVLSVCFIFAGTMISAQAAESDFPSSYSSVDMGFVTEVKSQKYNDCWAYAALSCFETKLLSEGYTVYSMSPEHVNLWATTHGDGTGWQRNISSVGYSDIALGYLMSWQGGVGASTYDELSALQEFDSDSIPTDLAEYGATCVRYLNDADRSEIKSAVMKNGSVYASYSQSSFYTSTDRTSYYCPFGSSIGTGHSVAVVGWDDGYSKSNFKSASGAVPRKDGAWLVKSSWGQDHNSIGGYLWISYEDAYLFSSRYKPVYTIEGVMPIDSGVKLMQNEIYGATYEFDYVQSTDEITYLNVFNFSNGYNELDSVIFETESAGADYEIYYVPVDNGKPVSDENKWTLLCSDTVPYEGYINADFDNFSLPVSYGAIAVKIDTSNINKNARWFRRTDNTLGVGEWLGTNVFLNDSHYGESYIYYDGKMSDLLTWYKEERDDDVGGTFVIKAVTRETEVKETLRGDVDLNSVFDINDATHIQLHLAYQTEFSAVQKLNADYDKNGIIDINDVTAIQMSLAGYKLYL